jgi:hypothetical protein
LGALKLNIQGSNNTANGINVLYNNTGNNNAGYGANALFNNTMGGNNTALGFQAGRNGDIGHDNVYIGANMRGVSGESNVCYIASIYGRPSAAGVPVLINSSNKLGTSTSSKRFKEQIKPMDNASEALFALKPVTFRYKKELDPKGITQFGLVAEEVEKVNPDLIVRDPDEKPYTVRYDAVNAMLLNEFLKEHKTVQEQGATIVRLEKQVETLTVRLQKVSVQLEVSNRHKWWSTTSKATDQIPGSFSQRC